MVASHGSFPARHTPLPQSLPWVSASPYSHTDPRSLEGSPAHPGGSPVLCTVAHLDTYMRPACLVRTKQF